MIKIKIALVVPCKNFINHAFETFNEHNRFEKVEKINDNELRFEIEELVANGDEALDIEFDSDVIMSRGITCQILKEHKQNIPIVDIPVQGIDLIRSLDECKALFGEKKVGVIGSINMIYGVEKLTDIVGLPIKSYIMNDIKEAPSLVDLAKSQGCEVILAGVVTCSYADSIGLHTCFINTGKETFHHAISEAKRLAIVSRKEQEKTQLYKTILNHAYEGVIAIGSKREILVFNTVAQELLGISDEYLIGRSVYDVVPQGKLRTILLSDIEYQEFNVVIYKSTRLAVKKVGIFHKGRVVGNMVTFQNVTGIQDMEISIRKKIHLRGHIAKHTFDDILHRSQIINMTIDTAKRFSEVDSNVLIVGETGTGKEIFAQSIHNNSKRKDGPFVAINCAALPENLLESELFGYVEGAFTGAMKGGKKGFFELAHGGTIFLDEIGEISPQLQNRLLRVLQEREINRIGDDKIIPIDVRVISATNKDLFQLAKTGNFREDLYYRLDVLKLRLPPLRERRDDIPILIESFIYEGSPTAVKILITDKAMNRLCELDWEGNVRQLRNFCERLVVLNRNNMIDIMDVERWIEKRKEEKKVIIGEDTRTVITSIENQSERERIVETLKNVYFNKGKAAQELKMSRTTLWRKIKEYNIETL